MKWGLIGWDRRAKYTPVKDSNPRRDTSLNFLQFQRKSLNSFKNYFKFGSQYDCMHTQLVLYSLNSPIFHLLDEEEYRNFCLTSKPVTALHRKHFCIHWNHCTMHCINCTTLYKIHCTSLYCIHYTTQSLYCIHYTTLCCTNFITVYCIRCTTLHCTDWPS